MSRSYIAFAAAAALGAGVAGSANAVELLTNGGFETGLSGWLVTDNGTGTWYSSALGADTPVLGFPTSATGGSGSSYAVSESATANTQDPQNPSTGPGAHALTQAFTVTAGSTVILKFVMFANDQSGLGPLGSSLDPNDVPNQHVQVDILTDAADPLSTTGGDVVTTLIGPYVDTGANPNDFTPYSFDISAFVGGGGTFQIRFAEVDNQFFLNMGVDSVSIDATAPAAAPEPATLAVLGIGLAALGLARRRRS